VQGDDFDRIPAPGEARERVKALRPQDEAKLRELAAGLVDGRQVGAPRRAEPK